MEEKYLHKSVLLEEAVGFLNLSPGKIVLDATVGEGGHSQEILKRIQPGGKLIGIDRDLESLKIANDRLASFKGSFKLIHNNFRYLKDIVKSIETGGIDGILFDLGISRAHIETEERGFSIKSDGPLDMRMDRASQGLTARDIVNKFTEAELSKIIKDFGEERFYYRIARAIVRERQINKITTTAQLAEIIVKNVPFKRGLHRIHPATRTFQALRIKVNDELGAIEVALKEAPFILNKNGRISVISFHSLEDRIVKNTFKEFELKGDLCKITKKPVRPTDEELIRNPRARSAKLRVAERML